MVKAWPLVGTAFIFTAGIVAGCSSSSDSSTAAPAAGTTTATAPTTPPATAATPPSTTPATAGLDGAALFAQNCSGCHGDKGTGGRKAPKLAGKHIAADEATTIITNGKGRMPAFGKRLQKEQIDAIAKYVSTL